MSRKSVLLAVGIALLLAGTILGGLALLIRNEPSAYSRVAVPAGEEREAHSKDFYASFWKLMNDIQVEDAAGEIEWGAEFTEEQINSYFEEAFVLSGTSDAVLPQGISQPRVAIEPNLLRVMFRYGSGTWSTVISIDLHVWLAANESNVVALELKRFRAGALPISAQSLLERISDALRRVSIEGNSIEVSWYRLNGNPVAVLHFQSDPQNSPIRLKNLRLEQGKITLNGSSSDASIAALMRPANTRIALEKSAFGRALALK
jgi:hypothetical protein